MVAPFGKVVRFNTRTQTCIEEVDVPTKEGAVLHLEVPQAAVYMTLLFLLPALNVTIGGSIVSCGSFCSTQGISGTGSAISRGCSATQIRSILREVTAEHEAKALYSAGGRVEMSQQVKRLVCCFRLKTASGAIDSYPYQLNDRLKDRGIVIEDVPFKQVVLPERLVKAIEQKMAIEQVRKDLIIVIETNHQTEFISTLLRKPRACSGFCEEPRWRRNRRPLLPRGLLLFKGLCPKELTKIFSGDSAAAPPPSFYFIAASMLK